MKKLFKIICGILMIAICLSSISLMGDVFGDRDDVPDREPTVDNTPEDTPEDPVEPEEPAIPNIQLPAEATSTLSYEEVTYHKLSKDPNSYLTLDGNFISYSGPSNYNFVDESNAFVSIALIDPCSGSEIYTNGIDMKTYSYVKLEFDILNDKYNVDERSVLGCTIYPIGRYNTDQYLINRDQWIDVKSSINTGTYDISDSSENIFTADTHHVEYVMEINTDDTSMSRMQIFINGELVFDNYGQELYTADIEYLSEIRLTYFESVSDNSSIGIGNLEISVYE